MTSMVNQQLFAEAYLRDLREATSSVDTVDACRQTIREWRSEYRELDRLDALLPYLSYSLSALGFSYQRHEDHPYVILYSDETHSQPLGACLAVTDDQLGRTTKGHHYHARLIRLLREQQLTWGIVTNGHTWRLCYVKANAPYEEYVEADLDALLDPTRLSEFLLFYRFFNREAFDFEARQNGHMPRQGLDRMLAESEKRTHVIERHLKNRVDDLLQSLCLGFVEDEAATSYSREQLDEIYRNAIYLLYRMLFLFYAEARHLLPVNLAEYQPVSLTSIIEDARRRQVAGVQNPDPHSLWKRLTRLFVIVDDGDVSVGVQAYNGGLFSDTEKPYLLQHKMSDAYLAPALFALGFVAGKGGPQPIDYRDLSVRHLGTLYEGMLEYRLNLVTVEPVIVRESGGKRIFLAQSAAGPIKKGETILGIGKVYFADDKGERKSSGSYYTPEDVVQYIVTNAVLPKLQEVRTTLEPMLAEAQREREIAATVEERDRIERYADQQILDLVNQGLLRLRILDPAMGSGHFLVAAGQMVTNFIVETLDATPWPNAMIDCTPLIWKRRVVERCLYGVDLNPLALELAKLALWISSASLGKPLTFLDHHLRSGNSLYGTPLTRLAALPAAKQVKDDPLFTLLRETVIASILQDLAEITSVDSDTIMTVKQKGAAFKQAEGKATRLRDIANVWLASLFALKGFDGKPLGDREYAQFLFLLTQDHSAEAWQRLVAGDTILSTARTVARDEQFFHWELEFADAVVDGVCRFDVVVANPPYVKFASNNAVKQLYKSAKCNDLYAWLLERGLQLMAVGGAIGTVVPLSVMFSGTFSSLRQQLLSGNLQLRLSSFDNVPDSIFNTGKTSNNTSTENMQRTTIIIAKSEQGTEKKIETTGLLRWWHEDRSILFSKLVFANTTMISSSENFPKISSDLLVSFWLHISKSKRKIADLAAEIFSEARRPDPKSIHITIPRITGYFISATPGSMERNGVLSLSFRCEEDMNLARVILNSNIFYWYWRSFGDGFHQNVQIVGNFPVPDSTDSNFLRLARSLDTISGECATFKMYRGERIPSYNFNRRMDLLLEIDDWFVKQTGFKTSLSRTIFAQSKTNSFLRPLDLSALSEASEPATEDV